MTLVTLFYRQFTSDVSSEQMFVRVSTESDLLIMDHTMFPVNGDKDSGEIDAVKSSCFAYMASGAVFPPHYRTAWL